MIKSSPFADSEESASPAKLLNAALELFSAKGFHGVSVKEICGRAEVNVSAISYHFGGKEGLLNSLLERMVREQRIEALPVDVTGFEDFQARLEIFLNSFIEFFRKNLPFIRLFFQELEYGLPEAERIFACSFEKHGRNLKEFIEIGRRHRFLRDPNTSSEIIVLQLLAPISELVRRGRWIEGLYGISIHDARSGEILVASLMKGLVKKPDSRSTAEKKFQ